MIGEMGEEGSERSLISWLSTCLRILLNAVSVKMPLKHVKNMGILHGGKYQ